MKAIKFAEPWKVDCVDQAMPEPKEGEALIKIHCAAVCGSAGRHCCRCWPPSPPQRWYTDEKHPSGQAA